MTDIVVAALYKFTPLLDLPSLKASLEVVCAQAGVKGTLILAHEGINGTIAASRQGIDEALNHIRGIPGCAGLEHKESAAGEMPFFRMKVRLKKEIVTMGVPGVDPNVAVGTYVEPEDWNALIADPDVVLIDTRNDYEVRVGTFEGAINPQTASFRDFPAWFEARGGFGGARKVAMFCTGGIRCEKATAYLKTRGFDEVYHLKGGILKYLETVPEADSRWRGECFVFDQRTTLVHGVAEGSYDLCHACRMPVSEADKASPDYVPGIGCPHCKDTLTADQKARFAERQKQIELARQRGEPHPIGRRAMAVKSAG
jgi:UPF0176 protein